MRNQILSEFRKLTSTRSAYWLLAGLLVLTGLSAAGILAGDEYGKDLANPLQDQPFLLLSLSMTTGIRSFTDEFRHGSIVPTLLATPDRRRVLAAKVMAVGAGAVVYVLAAIGIALAVGLPWLTAEGIAITWSIGPLAEVCGRLVVAGVLWSTIGVGLGLAVRHQAAAIVGAAVWLMAGETAVAALLPDAAKYLPGAAGDAIAGFGATDLLAPGMAVAILIGWAALATVIGNRLMRRRDIA
jgi:ABC-type transport system involved in multi-copper enzyme maturation permease subunit